MIGNIVDEVLALHQPKKNEWIHFTLDNVNLKEHLFFKWKVGEDKEFNGGVVQACIIFKRLEFDLTEGLDIVLTKVEK